MFHNLESSSNIVTFDFRRLYAWLLGNEVNLTLLDSDHPLVKLRKARELNTVKYFEMYSRDLLVQV